MTFAPKSQQFFYVVIAAAIIFSAMIILSAQKSHPNLSTTQAVTQDQMSQSDDLDSIQNDLDNTELNELDSEMENIEDQFNY